MVVLPGIKAGPDFVGGFEEAAFDQLYRQWHPDVVALCRRLLGRLDDAEDAAQEAFLRAWSARDRYSPVMPFRPWLATIARRVCADRRRRLAKDWAVRVMVELDDVDHRAAFALEHVVEVGEDLRILVRAIDGLRPAERRTLVWREVHGWSYQRIAVAEGMTVEAVRGALKRARASLRQSALEDGLVDAGSR